MLPYITVLLAILLYSCFQVLLHYLFLSVIGE